MAINKKVNTRFTANGDINKRFSIMERAAARFGRSADKSFRMVNRRASKFNKITSGFLKAQVIGKGFGLLSRGLGSVTQQFIDFDKAAIAASARFSASDSSVLSFAETLDAVKKAGRDAGATTEFTAAQATAGLDFMAKAGWSTAEAIGGLGSMINLATSTGEDFARVADISSDLMGSFGLNADTTAQKIKNLNRLNDVLVKTTNSANVTVETMFETMKQVGPIATGILGASLEEVAALTGVLGNSGIKGSEAMTALKNAYLRLAAPTSAARKTLDFFNITLSDGEGGVKKITDVMAELSKEMKGLDPVKQAEILDQIFGKRAIAGSKNLMANIGNIKKLEKSLLAAGGASQKTADIMRTSIENKLKALGSAATEAGFKIFSAFEVDGKNGIDALTEAIRNADMQPFIESLKVIASTLGAIAKFTFEFGGGLGITAAKIVEEQERISQSKFEPSNVFKSIRDKFFAPGTSAGSFGADFDPDQIPKRQAPNQAEATASAQQQVFRGRLDIAGAPEGSSLSTNGGNSGGSGFDLNLLGAN